MKIFVLLHSYDRSEDIMGCFDNLEAAQKYAARGERMGAGEWKSRDASGVSYGCPGDNIVAAAKYKDLRYAKDDTGYLIREFLLNDLP